MQAQAQLARKKSTVQAQPSNEEKTLANAVCMTRKEAWLKWIAYEVGHCRACHHALPRNPHIH